MTPTSARSFRTVILYSTGIIFFAISVFCGKADASTLTENISISLDVSGDVSGFYDFSGAMGEEIEAQSLKDQPVCQTFAHFRRALYQHKNSMEVWIKFKCTEEGQKKTYQPSRFFIDPAQETAEVQLPILDRPLKNVHLKFHDLSFKKGK